MKDILIFTDGASKGNPGPGGWGAVLILGEAHVTELGDGVSETTNNRMELQAAISAIQQVRESDGIRLFTDSAYLVHGVTAWLDGWKRRGWKTVQNEPVLNQDLWQELDEYKEHFPIEWVLLPGHSGIPGNERADVIASLFAEGKTPELYDGPLSEYPLGETILNAEYEKEVKEKRSKKKARSRAKAHSYLSLVEGKLEIHETWKECEDRVKGVSGARYKKALSPEEEKLIKEEWGAEVDEL